MLSNIAVLALAAFSAVSASPLQARQTTVSVAVSSASSAASSASSVISSAASNVTSTVSSSSAAANATTSRAGNSTSTATSTAASVSPSATGVTGNQSYPAYPCPAGYLLTYVEQNVTLPVRLAAAKAAFGNWSTSPFFPNVTNSTGGSTVGSTHVLTLQGVSLTEALVNRTMNSTTGYESFTWNLTSGPVSFSGVSVSNYSTVLQFSDPAINAGRPAGNSTLLDIYTNFCASSQPIGMGLISALSQLELGTFSAVVARAGGGGGGSSTSSMASSSAARTSSAVSSATSAAGNVTSHASNSTSAARSSATSVLANVTSSVASVTSTSA